MIIEELSAKPRPRNIHAHTVEGDFHAGVGHLFHGLAVGLVVGHAYRSASKTVVDGSVDRESQSLGRRGVTGVARRNFNADRGPKVGNDGSSLSRRWSTRNFKLVGEIVLKVRGIRSSILTGELSAKLLQICDFVLVPLDLRSDLSATVLEELPLCLFGSLSEGNNVLLFDLFEAFVEFALRGFEGRLSSLTDSLKPSLIA
jgi:hypothetical protein